MADEGAAYALWNLVRRFRSLGGLARLNYPVADGRLRGGNTGMLLTTTMRQEWHA